MVRWIFGWILAGFGFLVVLIPACNEFSQVAERYNQVKEKIRQQAGEPSEQTERVLNASAGNGAPPTRAGQHGPQTTYDGLQSTSPLILDRNASEIIIGTFNIQVFGVAKINTPEEMETLVAIARQFDVLAIQEIRSKHDQTIMEQFMDMINADGSRYNYVISPLLGTNHQTEQLAFIFDTTRIELLDPGGVLPDPHELLKREPMYSRFRTRTANPQQGFSFALANVHLSPNHARDELTTLYEMLIWLRNYVAEYEDDVILLGDFNVPPRRYGQLWQLKTLVAALPEGVTTNTLRDASYDNILFDHVFTAEYTGKSGVLDFQQAFRLTLDQALEVSDHLPVWASFHAAEMGPDVSYANESSGWPKQPR